MFIIESMTAVNRVTAFNDSSLKRKVIISIYYSWFLNIVSPVVAQNSVPYLLALESRPTDL